MAGGLNFYVGAGNLDNDGGYAAKVMLEHARLLAVVAGKRLPTTSLVVQPGLTPPTTVSIPAKAATEKLPAPADKKSDHPDAEKLSEQVAAI